MKYKRTLCMYIQDAGTANDFIKRESIGYAKFLKNALLYVQQGGVYVSVCGTEGKIRRQEQQVRQQASWSG